MADALLGIYWVLSHTVAHAAHGVGGALQVAVLKRSGGKWEASIYDDDAQQQIAQHVESMKASIGNYMADTFAKTATSTPPPAPRHQ